MGRSIQPDLLCGPPCTRSGQNEGGEEMEHIQAAGLPAMNLVDIGRRLLGVGTHYSHYSLYSRYRPTMACEGNCSGHGQCLNGSCYCMIQYEGSLCDDSNFAYHVAFSSIFSLMSLTSLIQLGMCIHSEYLRQKTPSIWKSLRVTTQKMLYFLTFLASSLRAIYFASPQLGSSMSASLMSAYYPVLLTGSSLVVCFWAEIFHLEAIRWDRPRFLSKSFLGFVTFNLITYSLLIAEFILLWTEHEDHEFYTHIFNGCYAGLMFVVVIFFLIYGVEVFFKVRGGFTIQNVPKIINSRRSPVRQSKATENIGEDGIVMEERRPMVRPKLCGISHGGQEMSSQKSDDVIHHINHSQLHQSRLGLLSQALMMMITVGFLLSETLSQFWKPKVDLTSQNTHVIIFRVVEIGVALWFPCVLWNCIKPEQLWILNPKQILKTFRHSDSNRGEKSTDSSVSRDSSASRSDDSESLECWICYDNDRTDAGSLIQPCGCKGDVGVVHHDCLRRWLVESVESPESLRCKVCNQSYEVERGSQFSLAQGFTTKHWAGSAGFVSVMVAAAGGCWAAIQLYQEAWIRMLAVGLALLVQYICLRFLGLNTVTAYQRAKVYGLKIMNKSLNRGGHHLNTVSGEQVTDLRLSRA